MIDSLVHPLPTLVLMAGLPGTGKTTLSEALGHELGWPVINKDELKRTFLKMGESDMRAGMMAYEIVFTLTRDLFESQRLSIILDTASLHLFILGHAAKSVQAVPNARLKIILCIVKSEIRAHRLKTRTGAIAQHTAEPSTLEEDMQLFRHLPQGFLIVDTLAPIEECVAKARHYLLNEETIICID
jgi:cytidylate kinase